MHHTPLAEQLTNPYAVAALCLNLVLLVLAPALALAFAERRTRRLAICTALLAVIVRLVGWSSLPGGVGGDDFETLRQMSHETFGFRSLFGENWDNGGSLFSNVSWYLAYRLSDSLLSIRFAGMLWSASLAVLVCCFAARLYGAFPALVCATLATVTVWSLFLSRLTFGSEILVLQICLIWASWLLRRYLYENISFSLLLIIVVGLLCAMSQYTYIGARVAPAIPVLVLGFWRFRTICALALVVCVALTAWQPHLMTAPLTLLSEGSQLWTLYDPRLGDLRHMLTKIGFVLLGFVDSTHSAGGTNAMPGAFTVGWFISLIVLSGVPFAPRFALLGAVGMLPVLVSTLQAGGSHRLMMMLVPLALVGGAGLHRLPVRLQKWPAVGIAAIVIVLSMQTWLSPDYWAAADSELAYSLKIHEVAHRELAANPNFAMTTGRSCHHMLVAQETGRTAAEVTSVDCSRQFTVMFAGDVSQTRHLAASVGGEVVPDTGGRILVMRLGPEGAVDPEIEALDVCRPDPVVAERREASPDDRGAAPRGAALTDLRRFEADIAFWLKADALDNLADGERVAAWPDSTRVTRGATQRVLEIQPTLRKNVHNDLPAVRFNHSTMVVRSLPLTPRGTQFYVLRAGSLQREFPFFEHGVDFNSNTGSLLYGSNPMFGVNRDGVLDLARGPGPGWMGRDWTVISAAYDDENPRNRFWVRKNGRPQPAGNIEGLAVGNTTAAATLYIGSRRQQEFWSTMDLGEILLFRRALSATEVKQVEGYLGNKWAIALESAADIERAAAGD